jgi:signal transduction histidine kinase/DNA-binding response OmpR family regulator
VLLVEDDDGDARLTERALHDPEAGIVALERVGRLSEALALVDRGSVDVVLLDLGLPDGQGLETVQRLLAVAPDVGVIVLTALDDQDLALQAVSAGAQDFLVKGIGAREMWRAIRYAHERKRAESAARSLEHERTERTRVEVAEQRYRYLAAVSRALASAPLVLDTVYELGARLAVPTLGDACVVEVPSDEGALVAVASASAASAGGGERSGPVVKGSVRAAGAIGEAAARALATKRVVAAGALHVPVVVADVVRALLTISGGSVSTGADEPRTDLAREFAARFGFALEHARLFERAEEAAGARDEVIAIVSHDMRNPLNVIAMTTALLAEDSALTEEKRARHLDKLRRATERMTSLIEDLVDVSLLDSGRFTIEPAKVPFPALLEEALDTLRAQPREATFTFELLGVPDAVVWGDRARLVKAIVKVVLHLAAYSAPTAVLRVEVESAPEAFVLVLRDPKSAIKPEHAAHLFDRAWQASHGGRRGAGVSLSIAEGIVLAHGGAIVAGASLEEGVVVRLTLPAARD